MNRLSKAILIALGALFFLAAAFFIGLNLYIQSPGTHARIEGELAKTLHVPLKITSATITPWGGLHLSGISMPPQDGSRLEAASFDANYLLLPLLRGRIAISKMTLEQPKIFWAQDDQGRWKLPLLAEAPGPKGPREPAKDKKAGVSLDAFEIKDGSIDLLDHDGQRVAFATAVNVQYRIIGENTFKGTLTAAQITKQGAITFKNVRTPFTYKDGSFSFDALQTSLAGGTATGSLSMGPSGKETPFKLALTLSKVDLATMTTEGNWPPGEAAGILNGKIDVAGNARQLESTTGTGHLDLANAAFGQLQLIQTIAQVLQIPGLSDLHIETGIADFHLSNQHVYITKCSLEKPDIRLAAKGNVRFDGRVSVDAILSVDGQVSRGLTSVVRDSFDPADKDGWRSIAFDISGRPDKLKTSLVDKILKRQLNTGFDNVLQNIFGGDQKKKNKKSDKGNPANPAAAAAPTPNSAPPAAPPAPDGANAGQKPTEP